MAIPADRIRIEHHGDVVERLREATALLERVAADRALLAALTSEERRRLMQAAGEVVDPDPAARRRLLKTIDRLRRLEKAQRDDERLAEAGIRVLRQPRVCPTPAEYAPPVFEPRDVAPAAGDEEAAHAAAAAEDAIEERACYVCKRRYTSVHHFYDRLCPECGDVSFGKRTETADLTGRVALLTGGRVKIGYEAGLKLLRCGAQLIVTTRFPRDSAQRYTREPDFGKWSHRLEIFGLDLRHTPSVEAFCRALLGSRA